MYIAGVDEAGRGPLVGPVVAAAVILPDNHNIKGLNDSKKLSEKKRESLYEEIFAKAISIGISFSSASEIDKINILQASLLAMHRAVDKLTKRPDKVLVDGNKLPDWDYVSEAIVGGDGIMECISAASIIAKVQRDKYLVELDSQFPEYGFAKHKGYGTKDHLIALQKYGPTKYHRKTFAPVRKLLDIEEV